MATNLRLYLAYWRHADLLRAVDAFVDWLDLHGNLDSITRFSEWKNERSAYPLSQLLAEKMSKDQAIRYLCDERLGWVEKEKRNLERARIKMIRDQYFEEYYDHLGLSKMPEAISKAQAQFEREASTAWLIAFADNVREA